MNNNTEPDEAPPTASLFYNLYGTTSYTLNPSLDAASQINGERVLNWVELLNNWNLVSIIWQPEAQWMKIKLLHKNKVAFLYVANEILYPL